MPILYPDELKEKPRGSKEGLRARRVFTCSKCGEKTKLVWRDELANPKCDACGHSETRQTEQEYGRRA